MLTAHREKTPASWQKQTKIGFVCKSSLHIFKGVHKVGKFLMKGLKLKQAETCRYQISHHAS